MKEFQFKSLNLTQTNRYTEKIWYVSLFILLFFIAMLFLPWRQTVEGEGELIGYDPTERIHTISATIDGFIDAYFADEDTHVIKGSKIFTMTDLDKEYVKRIYSMKKSLQEQYNNTEEEIKALHENKKSMYEQKKIRSELFSKRYIQAQEKLDSIVLKRKAQLSSYTTELNNYTRIENLYKEKIESKRTYERARNIYIGEKAKLEKIDIDTNIQKRHLSVIKEEEKQFLHEIANTLRTIENTILTTQTRLNALKREQERQFTDIARYETAEVLAEKNGTVVRILRNDKNTYVKKGEPVIQFSPDIRARAILLKITDFNMPLIKEDLRVRIRFYGWPVLNIPGWPLIRFGTFGGIIKKVDPVAHEKGYYYAYVVEDPKEPWPAVTELRAGTSATVWVALSTVPIWYQLWRSMNAFPPNMVNPGKK